MSLDLENDYGLEREAPPLTGKIAEIFQEFWVKKSIILRFCPKIPKKEGGDLDNVCKAIFDVFPNAGLSFLIISWEKEHQLDGDAVCHTNFLSHLLAPAAKVP